jgi:SHS2 domain-containing protein
MKNFEFLEHTADIKFQAFGKTIEKAFSNSAYAMINSITEDKIKSKQKKTFHIKGNDLKNLLYNFLEEFLFLFDSEEFILSEIKDVKINLETFELTCLAIGDCSKEYSFNTHVKAITYNEMFVKKTGDKWVTQVVLDV